MMIHTRQQLINWITEHVIDRTLQSAMKRGEIEVLGGFDPLPTSTNPGWMVQIKTACATYLIAVAEDQANLGQFYWFNAPHVEWNRWLGNMGELYAGDNPELYSELRGSNVESA